MIMPYMVIAAFYLRVSLLMLSHAYLSNIGDLDNNVLEINVLDL